MYASMHLCMMGSYGSQSTNLSRGEYYYLTLVLLSDEYMLSFQVFIEPVVKEIGS